MNMYYLYWIAPKGSSYPKAEGYIGISNQPEKRFLAHTTNTSLVGSKLIRAYIEEHGINSVEHTILNSFNTLDEARDMERLYRPSANIGWNIKTGGGISPDCTGRLHDNETKQKIREGVKYTKSQRTYHNKFKGTKNRYTEEERKHIGSFHKGKTITAKHRQAISEKLSGDNHPRAKEIRLLDTIDNSIYEFNNLKTASESLGINYSSLRSAVRNNQEMLYKRWKLL